MIFSDFMVIFTLLNSSEMFYVMRSRGNLFFDDTITYFRHLGIQQYGHFWGSFSTTHKNQQFVMKLTNLASLWQKLTFIKHFGQKIPQKDEQFAMTLRFSLVCCSKRFMNYYLVFSVEIILASLWQKLTFMMHFGKNSIEG